MKTGRGRAGEKDMGELTLIVTLDGETVIGSTHSEDVKREHAVIRAMELMAVELATTLVYARKHEPDKHKGGQNGE